VISPRVHTDSERGSVRNSVPAQEDPGTLGTLDKVAVRARTRHGDIIIQRAAG
jgi:hypothetical protein